MTHQAGERGSAGRRPRSDGLVTKATRLLLAEADMRIYEFHQFLDNEPRRWTLEEAERLVRESYETRRRIREFLEVN